MRKLITALCLTMAFTLVGCGGDEKALTVSSDGAPLPGTPGGAPIIASVDVITNNPQIPSDGGIPATITAFVKDSNNNFVEGVPVLFSSTSGGIVVSQGITDVNGVATATVSTAGDPTNRTITITATAETLIKTIDIQVTGSQLTITGPDSLVQNDTAAYTIVLVDGAGSGIVGETLTITSANGNTLAAATLVTDAGGQAQVDLTATQGGTDTLTATGLGLTATRVITVSDDVFSFDSPAPDTEINLGNIQVVNLTWTKNGLPQTGQNLTISTTRGEFVVPAPPAPPVVTTNAAGQATLSIRSNNAGPAVISAVTSGGLTTQLPVEFIATNPATIEVQASPFTVAPNNQATITAVVRDADNNRVKNAQVTFSLSDITGGSLAVGSAETDSQGRAQTFYTASDVASGNLGVQVTAFIEANPSITDTVSMTVARRELFVALGTGNELIEADIATYEIPYLVIVTDSEGNGVPDSSVQVDVRSVRYSKGKWTEGPEVWFAEISATCDDEDLNGNGILDPDEVDINGNGTIEAGNVVQVVGGDALTDADGKAIVSLRYPQVYGNWTEVSMRAQLSVSGEEFFEELTFVLPVSADDIGLDVSPPGLLQPLPGPPITIGGLFLSSPWGFANTFIAHPSPCVADF